MSDFYEDWDFRYLNWSHEEIKKHFENNPPYKGQELIVCSVYGGRPEYFLVKVEIASSGRQKRIVVGKGSTYGGRSYYRSGKNCHAPTGQVRLLPYHKKLGALIKAGEADFFKPSDFFRALDIKNPDPNGLNMW